MKNILLFIETIVRKITRKIQKLQKYIYINIINNTSLIDKLVVVYLYLVCFLTVFMVSFVPTVFIYLIFYYVLDSIVIPLYFYSVIHTDFVSH